MKRNLFLMTVLLVLLLSALFPAFAQVPQEISPVVYTDRDGNTVYSYEVTSPIESGMAMWPYWYNVGSVDMKAYPMTFTRQYLTVVIKSGVTIISKDVYDVCKPYINSEMKIEITVYKGNVTADYRDGRNQSCWIPGLRKDIANKIGMNLQ